MYIYSREYYVARDTQQTSVMYACGVISKQKPLVTVNTPRIAEELMKNTDEETREREREKCTRSIYEFGLPLIMVGDRIQKLGI